MVRRPAGTGFTVAHSPKPAIRRHGAIPRILRIWVCIRDGDGPGRRIAACFTIARRATPKDGYTVVCTTYRLTELYHYWTKNNPMNVQLVPEPFVEISAQMADEMGIKGGEKVKVSSIRGEYIAKAMVTKRIKSMMIDGKKVYQIGIPIHQGYRGIKEDEGKDARTLVNLLTPTVFDPNAYTPEFKGFLVKLERA